MKELEDLKDLHELAYGNDKTSWKIDEIVQSSNIKKALLKLDFLEDAIDLPTNCFSTFKNRNGDEVTVMRKERYEEYEKQEKENREYKQIEENIGCPFNVIEHLINMKQFYFEKNGKKYIIEDYVITNNVIKFDSGTRLPGYEVCSLDCEVPFTMYGKMFWLKEDKSDTASDSEECGNCLYCKYEEECDNSWVKEAEKSKIKIKFGDLTPRELVEGFESVYIFRDKETNEMMVEYALRCKNDFVYLDKVKLDSEISVDKNIIKPELHSSTSIKDMTLSQIVDSKPLDEFGDVSLDEEYWFGDQYIRVRYYGD